MEKKQIMGLPKAKITETKLDGMSVLYSNDIFLHKNDDGQNNVELIFNIKYKIIFNFKNIDDGNGGRVSVDNEKTVDGESMAFNIIYSNASSSFGVTNYPLHIFTRTGKIDNEDFKEKVFINFAVDTISGNGKLLKIVILSKAMS